jgi:hypothetical protein
VLHLDECLLLLAYISLSTQSGNFWIHSRTSAGDMLILGGATEASAGKGCGRKPSDRMLSKICLQRIWDITDVLEIINLNRVRIHQDRNQLLGAVSKS